MGTLPGATSYRVILQSLSPYQSSTIFFFFTDQQYRPGTALPDLRRSSPLRSVIIPKRTVHKEQYWRFCARTRREPSSIPSQSYPITVQRGNTVIWGGSISVNRSRRFQNGHHNHYYHNHNYRTGAPPHQYSYYLILIAALFLH
ncbi:hypothetical protein TYRP_019652 [Tyrophagus putrescentiae]|nr:hypothetical protein TYRP_019652 [Tyrophagus putrescentiae]